MRSALIIFSLFFLAGGNAQQPVSSGNVEIVFRNVNVISMENDQVTKSQDVTIINGMITSVLPAGNIAPGKNALVINATGKYLIPGLAEMHAHVPPVDNLEPMKEVLMLFACNGVTTIRGMLGHPRHLELREKINGGEILGPRFITSGPSLNGNTVRTPEAADQMVREQKKAGYDFLKLHPGLTRKNFDAIAATAKEVGIPLAGHVSFDVGVWRAIEAGYATIDHMDGFVESLVPEIKTITESETGLFGMNIADRADTNRIGILMKSLREKNIWVVPTQSLAERWFTPDLDADALAREQEMIYVDSQTLENWVNSKKSLVATEQFDPAAVRRFITLRRKLIYACQQQGVGLLLGSDAPQVFDVPGFSLHHELRYMVEAGLTPYEALKCGTVNVARYLGRTDMGMIKPGYVSDLILLDGNPLEDISNTRKISGVMLGKQWLSGQFIRASLEKLEKREPF